MNPTRKSKRKLLKRENQLKSLIRMFEILENRIKNDEEGKTPKMFSLDKSDLIQWLEDHKEINKKVKKEFYEIREQLKDLG